MSSFSDKTKLLLEAVKEENLNAVTVLCASGTDVNAQDSVRRDCEGGALFVSP